LDVQSENRVKWVTDLTQNLLRNGIGLQVGLPWKGGYQEKGGNNDRCWKKSTARPKHRIKPVKNLTSGNGERVAKDFGHRFLSAKKENAESEGPRCGNLRCDNSLHELGFRAYRP